MKFTLAAMAAGIALALTVSAAQSAPAPSASAPSYTASCDQAVDAGHFTCFALRRIDLKAMRSADPATTPDGYGPADLKSAYDLPASDTSATVAIVDAYDDPSAESDLDAYRSYYGLPACTTANGCFTKLNQEGEASPLPAADEGWAQEISLDLDMVSAACPSCHITLIEADDNSDNLFAAVKKATDLGIKDVSMSWGGTESADEATYDSTYFATSGVVYAASSGDDAYAGGVSYPSSSPRVVSVGGTSLSRASNARGWSESVWETTAADGAGSGCSAYEPKPSFQSGAVAGSICGQRADTDVSAVADPATGVAVYSTYGGDGWSVYGGTSAAAPIIAGVYALAGTPGSGDQPASYLYEHADRLNDVTTGANGSCSPAALCSAGVGWDGPTGLGTPNGVTAFSPSGGTSGNKVTLTDPGDQSGAVGTSVSLQIQATDSAPDATLSYAATGLPSGLSIDADTGLISGRPTAGGVAQVEVTATDDTGASATSSFRWTVDGAGTGCTGQALTNGDFEDAASGWTASGGVINTDKTYAHSGYGYAWLDGYGVAHRATLTQRVAIPSGCSATLAYQLWVQSYEATRAPHDTLTLTVDGHRLQTFSNADRASGYVTRSVDLSAYAGRTVTLTWTGTENATLATSFFLDDAALTLG